jgi:hypothetical protein
MTQPNNIIALVTWTLDPSSGDIFAVLAAMSDEELERAARMKSAAGRIAWLEQGRRLGHADFDVAVSYSNDEVKLDFTTSARPIHEVPSLGEN